MISCKKDPKDADPSTDTHAADRALMLTNIADESIIPSYSNLNLSIDTFSNDIAVFKTSPTLTNLQTLRISWEKAYIAWQKVELFDVGPANQYALRNYANIYPANELIINSNLLDENTNLEISSNYAAQGFPAFDYLLNGLASTDDSIVTLYTTASNAQLRLNYLTKLATQLSFKVKQTLDLWNSAYRADFISSTSLKAGSSTSMLINGYVMNYEKFIRLGKFGIPSGAVSTLLEPTKVEGFYKKDISQKLALAAHQASVNFFNGKSVKTGSIYYGLAAYLNALEAKDTQTNKLLSVALNEQFDINNNAILNLNSNFYYLVNNDNQKLIDAFNELQKAVRILKVDMTSAMSITITYTDNDGD
jgi:hypothetical protein